MRSGTQKATLSGANRVLKCSVGSCPELNATGSAWLKAATPAILKEVLDEQHGLQ